MSQFVGFNVSFAGTTAYSVWTVTHAAVVSGPFSSPEALTWPGGVGIFISTSDIGSGGVMRLIRLTGDDPAVGDTVTGGTSGATALITAITILDELGRSINPPGFDGSGNQGAVVAGDFFVIAETAYVAQGFSITGTPIHDSFAIDVAPSPGNPVDQAGVITRDFTPVFGWPVPNPGDTRVAAIVRRALVEVETTFASRRLQALAFGSSDDITGSPVADAYLRLQSVGDAAMGYKMLRPGSVTGLSLILDVTVVTVPGTSDAVFSVRKNGAALGGAPSVATTIAATGKIELASTIVAPGVAAFAAGDRLSVFADHDGVFDGTISNFEGLIEIQV